MQHDSSQDDAALEAQLLHFLRKCEELLGSHPKTAVVLNMLAVLYLKQGRLTEAEPLSQRALAINEKVLGLKHPDTATSLNTLASLYYSQGKYREAEPLFQRVVEIDEESLGEFHPDTALSLNNLAALYHDQGRFPEAELLFQRVMKISENVLGAEHPSTATSIHNLAELYRSQGRFPEAEPLYRRAWEMCENVLGVDDPDTAISINGLASLYYDQGRLTEAEPLYQRVVEICENKLGKHHSTATSLNSLANLYRMQGRYDKAEPLFRRALAIYAQTLGEHPKTAASLTDLALLYYEQGKYLEAAPLSQRALAINENKLGVDHPRTAASLNSLALLYNATGAYSEAKALFQRTLAIREKALGAEHPETALSLNSLALFYYVQGNYQEAEPLYQRALKIREKVLGAEHPHTAESLYQLGLLYASTDRRQQAIDFLQRASLGRDRLREQVFASGSQRERMSILHRDFGLYSTLLSLAREESDSFWAFEHVLRHKGLGAEVLATQRDAILSGQYPKLTPQIQALAALQNQICRKTLEGPGLEEPTLHRKILDEWATRRDRLEAELAQKIPEMNLRQKLHAVDCRAVASKLPEGTALIEFACFRTVNFHAVIADGESLWDTDWYIAFVLTAETPGHVKMIDLGQAELIDQKVNAFLTDIGPSISETSESRGAALREALLIPLATALGKCKRLLIAPDGDLSRLPFEILPHEHGGYVMDQYRISYLTVGRDVLRLGVPSTHQSSAPLVLADPDFDLVATDSQCPTSAPLSNLNSPPETLLPSTIFGSVSRDLNRSNTNFTSLPGARLEGHRAATQLAVTPWMGQFVLEGRLKTCQSPQVLHLATHGFFLPDQRVEAPRQTSFSLLEVRLSDPVLEDPMLRSGLALAGANTWLRGGHLPFEAEDGLLTASDVTGMNLLGTELVVLSACDTGRGIVQAGEGVLGLRRAFTLAGARTLVMSLWKVEDLPTAILMERFYDHLHAGKARDLALHEAQEYVRNVTIGELRSTWLSTESIVQTKVISQEVGKYLEWLHRRQDIHRPFEVPYFWAAFICQGEVAPLSLTQTVEVDRHECHVGDQE